MQIAEGAVIAGRYQLEKPLARGGMGSVWVARHLQLDARVAVKFMDANVAASPGGRTRFEREAKAAAQIHSPHVVTIHDYGVAGETPYLVMELLRGEDLGARLRRSGALPLPAAAGVITHVARALRLAHGAGIVHRDLKPGNVFLAVDDDAEIAKVLDFGIAKNVGLQQAIDPEEATKSDQILGSPQYMSPEQVKRSSDVDHRSDVWSLAVIAYRTLTDQLPFKGDSIAEVLIKICSEPAPPPSEHRPDLPPAVDAFFARALAKAPQARFQTAPDLAAAFTEALGLGPGVAGEVARSPLDSKPAHPESTTVPDLPPELLGGATPLQYAGATRAQSISEAPRSGASRYRLQGALAGAAVALALGVAGVVLLVTQRGGAPGADRPAASALPGAVSVVPAAPDAASHAPPAAPPPAAPPPEVTQAPATSASVPAAAVAPPPRPGSPFPSAPGAPSARSRAPASAPAQGKAHDPLKDM